MNEEGPNPSGKSFAERMRDAAEAKANAGKRVETPRPEFAFKSEQSETSLVGEPATEFEINFDENNPVNVQGISESLRLLAQELDIDALEMRAKTLQFDIVGYSTARDKDYHYSVYTLGLGLTSGLNDGVLDIIEEATFTPDILPKIQAFFREYVRTSFKVRPGALYFLTSTGKLKIAIPATANTENVIQPAFVRKGRYRKGTGARKTGSSSG